MVIEMNKRTTEIMMHVLSYNTSSTLKDLALKFNVGERTIRNDIQIINSFLNEQKALPLLIEGNGTISFRGGADEKNNIIALLERSDYYSYKLSSEERKDLILLTLFISDKYVTISYLSDKLMVSRSTVINDIDLIREKLKCSKVKIQSYSNKGLVVKGNEENIRRFMFKIVNENCKYLLESNLSFNLFEFFMFKELYNDFRISQVDYIIRDYEEMYGDIFTDISFNELISYITIMIKRVKINRFIKIDKETVERVMNNAVYHKSKCLYEKMEGIFNIAYCNDEVAALAQQLLCKNYIRKNSDISENTMDLQFIVGEFIYQISKELNVNLELDLQLNEYLVNHIEATSYRIKENSCLINPLKDKLMEQYSYLFNLVKSHMQELERYIGHKMSADEISYIVMHIEAAIQRNKTLNIPLRVVVVCNTGLGTAQFLVEKIKQYFTIEVVEVTSSHNLNKVVSNKAFDLIISTVPIADMKYPFIQVEPIPTSENINRIQKYLTLIRDSKVVSTANEKLLSKEPYQLLLNDVMSIVEKHTNCDSKVKTELQKEIDTAINKRFNSNNNDKDVGAKRFYEIIDESLIKLDVIASDWRDAVYKGGQILLEKDKISSGYIDAMISNIEQNEAYVVIAPGIAIPHAAPNCGAKELAISIIRLKNEVCFGHKKNDPVKFIFCMSVLNSKSHLKAFFSMINLVCNNKVLEELKAATSPSEFISIIKRYDK